MTTPAVGPAPRPYERPVLVTPANEDVAADALEGSGVLSSWKDLGAAAGSGDAGEVGFAAAAAGMDALGAAMNPLGSLAGAGIGWLIEHVSFLHEPLDWLAGDPGQITAQARTWHNAAAALRALGDDHRIEVDRLTGWDGEAAAAYRHAAGTYVAGLRAGSDAAADLSEQVLSAGAAVGTVRALIRDLVADAVGEIIALAVVALAAAALSAGGSVAGFVGWSVSRAVMTAAETAEHVAQLLDRLAGVGLQVSRTADDLSALAGGLGRLAGDVNIPVGRHSADPFGRWLAGRPPGLPGGVTYEDVLDVAGTVAAHPAPRTAVEAGKREEQIEGNLRDAVW